MVDVFDLLSGIDRPRIPTRGGPPEPTFPKSLQLLPIAQGVLYYRMD